MPHLCEVTCLYGHFLLKKTIGLGKRVKLWSETTIYAIFYAPCRRRGFNWANRMLKIFTLMILLGVGSFILQHHFQIDVKTPTLKYINKNVYRPAYAYLNKTVFIPAVAFIKKNLMEKGGKGDEL